ncbi:transcription factor TFIIE beta subunit- DNA-binding domain-containingprotein [Apiospora saccharicola]|uniref:Transcription initiation factor IIE subunit beta n=1 Tax=Apiospora saccharicola TaxID=335842 RepID=A0ABR1U7C9_9PEZI
MSSKLGVNGTKRALAPPSPSPSNASNASHGTPSKRQKRADAANRIRDHATPTPAAAAAASQSQNFGEEMMTQLTYAVEFLKAKGEPKTLADILNHLTMQHHPEEAQSKFVKYLRRHHQINFIAHTEPMSKTVPAWRYGMYEFRAKIPGVIDKTSLLQYLQNKTDASKLDVKDLKDGWPDCDQALRELEGIHKILVVRTKKDGHAKYIWRDQQELFNKVDPEFQVQWQRVKLPAPDDMNKKLISVGIKPASEDPQLKVKETAKGKQKRKPNRTTKKVTNTHMQHLLKDYSHLKRG